MATKWRAARAATACLLFSAGSGAKPPVVTVQMISNSPQAPSFCETYRGQVLKELAGMVNLPAWQVVVTCDDAMWGYLRGAQRTNSAFTSLKEGRAPLTVLHGGYWKDSGKLRESLEHELKHIRCQCSLGE